jgi:hypothetical protein
MVSGSIGEAVVAGWSAKAGAPNRPVTEKKAVRERMTPPQVLVI